MFLNLSLVKKVYKWNLNTKLTKTYLISTLSATAIFTYSISIDLYIVNDFVLTHNKIFIFYTTFLTAQAKTD
jgi:hypothetical protein